MELERTCCLKLLDLILTQMCQVCLANYKLNWMLGLFTAFWGRWAGYLAVIASEHYKMAVA